MSLLGKLVCFFNDVKFILDIVRHNANVFTNKSCNVNTDGRFVFVLDKYYVGRFSSENLFSGRAFSARRRRGGVREPFACGSRRGVKRYRFSSASVCSLNYVCVGERAAKHVAYKPLAKRFVADYFRYSLLHSACPPIFRKVDIQNQIILYQKIPILSR